MLTFLRISIFLVLIVKIGSEVKICAQIKGDLIVEKAFRLNQYTVLLTSKNGVLRIKHLMFSGNKLTFESINRWENWFRNYKKLENITTFFPMIYPNKTKRIFGTAIGKREEVYIFTSYAIEFDHEVSKVRSVVDVSIDPYKYKPNEDPLNLKSLFDKFPQNHIDVNMKAILSFPFNEDSLPRRLFAYFKETKPKSTEIMFKRHIMIGEPVRYENFIQNNWHHEESSGKCHQIESRGVDATLTISDYTKSGSDYTFDIIEFSGKYYYLKRVKSSKDKVYDKLTTIRRDSINQMIGCFSVAETTGAPDHSPQPDKKTTIAIEKRKSKSNAVAILLTLFIIVVFISILFVGIFISLAFRPRNIDEENL